MIDVGNIIKFGSYWQGASKDAGKTPIEWRVLAKDGNKALVISEYALDNKPYNDEWIATTWEQCTLRRWLNNEFLNNAFTAEEQQAIQSTYVTADRNPEFETNPGNSTTDKVFLLSITEVCEYFRNDRDRKCVPTAYAKVNGACTDGNYTKNGIRTCWWWLRVPGGNQLYAVCVNYSGGIYYGGNRVYRNYDCVRPALWIDLSICESESDNTTTSTENSKSTSNGDSSRQGSQVINVGSIIKFGAYWQGASTSAGKTPIEWIVLDEQKDSLLLISKLVLDAQAYNEYRVDITWENCTLRKWLNFTFLNNAFSKNEQCNIINSKLKNNDNLNPLRLKWMQQLSPHKSTVPGGNDTVDKLFILSWEEAIKYFPIHPQSDKLILLAKAAVAMFNPQDMSVVARPLSGINVDGTQYAKEHNLDNTCGAVTVWFRSPGNTSQMAVSNMLGHIMYRPGCEVDDSTNGIRPALWVSKKAFMSAEELEKLKNREEETRKKNQVDSWKKQGLCQYCGGKIKGFFIKKCSICGNKKDY